MLQPDLCDYSDAYIVVKGTIAVRGTFKKKTLWPLFMDGVQLPQG